MFAAAGATSLAASAWYAYRTFFPRPVIPKGPPRLNIIDGIHVNEGTEVDWLARQVMRGGLMTWTGALTLDLQGNLISIGVNRSDPDKGHFTVLGQFIPEQGQGEPMHSFRTHPMARPVPSPEGTAVMNIWAKPSFAQGVRILFDLGNPWVGNVLMDTGGQIHALGDPAKISTTHASRAAKRKLFTVEGRYDANSRRLILPAYREPSEIRLPLPHRPRR